MRRLGALLARAIVGALLLVALNSSIASADTGRLRPGDVVTPTNQAELPEDPGIGCQLPEDPGLE